MNEHGICAKCKKSVGCPYADDRITGCKKFVLEPELELANEEWLRQASTEELAEWLKKHMNCNFCPMRLKCEDMRGCMEIIKVWLQQPHTAK